jgi:hypothetical protein
LALLLSVQLPDEPNAITINVGGQLVDNWVDAVETCSYQAMGQGRHFLRYVSHIDEHGRSLPGLVVALAGSNWNPHPE